MRSLSFWRMSLREGRGRFPIHDIMFSQEGAREEVDLGGHFHGWL